MPGGPGCNSNACPELRVTGNPMTRSDQVRASFARTRREPLERD